MTQVRSVRRKGSGALRLRLGRCLCAYSLRSQTMQHSVNPARHNLDFKIEPMRVQITLYRIEFWKMDLGAFTGRGQGGPCLTDAAQ
jgi:hypothetical protein